MPSLALQRWFAERAATLDEMERAHRALRGSGPGVRTAMLQINQAYTMMVSGQFQGYCRDFHDESASILVASIADHTLRRMVLDNLSYGRRLDRGNPSPASIGADVDRFVLRFWPLVLSLRHGNAHRRRALEEMNEWRNAIAHQDFAPSMFHLGRPLLRLAQVQTWRGACDGLVRSFEEVMDAHIRTVTGTAPW